MMCLRLLESVAEAEPQLEFVLTEADMLAHIHSKEAAKLLAASKRTKRSLSPENLEVLGVAPRLSQLV